MEVVVDGQVLVELHVHMLRGARGGQHQLAAVGLVACAQAQVVVHRLQRAGREVEGFADDTAVGRLQLCMHQRHGRRPESVGIRHVGEPAQVLRQGDAGVAACGHGDGQAGLVDPRIAAAVEAQGQFTHEWLGTLVDEVHRHAVYPFVGDQHGHRLQYALQRMEAGLGQAGVVDQAPAGAGPEVAQEPHERPAAARARAPPFGEGRGHHLARHDAAEREVTLVVHRAQLHRVDLEERGEVMVAHVFEVPAGVEVARRALLPAGVVHPQAQAAGHAGHGALVGYVGEGEALGGEAQLRAARIVERPQVGPHAVVRRGAGVGLMRKRAAMRARWPVGHPRQRRFHRLAQGGVEERRRPQLAWRAPHRCLLLALAVAADDGHTGTALPARRLLRHLGAHAGEEGLVVPGVVHAGEHELLPHQHAERIAGVEEGIALVNHGAADTQHVHAGIAGLLHGREQRFGAAREGHHLERCPAGAAAEDGHAVDLQTEAACGGVGVEAPEAEGAQALRGRAWRITPLRDEAGLVERGFAVGMGPPQRRPRHGERALVLPVGDGERRAPHLAAPAKLEFDALDAGAGRVTERAVHLHPAAALSVDA